MMLWFVGGNNWRNAKLYRTIGKTHRGRVTPPKTHMSSSPELCDKRHRDSSQPRFKGLAGRSDQSVFEIKQAMGGGKIHSMITYDLLSKSPALRTAVRPEIAYDAGADAAKPVAVNGRSSFEEAKLQRSSGKRPGLQLRRDDGSAPGSLLRVATFLSDF